MNGNPQTENILLGFGSNIGDGPGNLRIALRAAERAGIRIRRLSSIYFSSPVGPQDQNRFTNAVALAETVLSPEGLLIVCKSVELELGRDFGEKRWGPRVIDIDLVVVGDESCDDPTLTLPHPRAHERGFVLVPWLNADPTASLPGHGPVRDLVANLDTASIVRVDDLMIALP